MNYSDAQIRPGAPPARGLKSGKHVTWKECPVCKGAGEVFHAGGYAHNRYLARCPQCEYWENYPLSEIRRLERVAREYEEAMYRVLRRVKGLLPALRKGDVDANSLLTHPTFGPEIVTLGKQWKETVEQVWSLHMTRDILQVSPKNAVTR